MNKVILMTALGLVCTGPAGLTGCATRADVGSLRSEVEQTNAIAVQAANDASISRTEVAKLKASTNPLETCSSGNLFETVSAPVPGTSGYKWDTHLRSPFDYITQTSDAAVE